MPKTLKQKGFRQNPISRVPIESPAQVQKVVKKYGFYMTPDVRKSFDKERKKGTHGGTSTKFWDKAR